MKRTALARRTPLRPRLKRIARAIDSFTGKPQRKTKHARRERAPAGWFAFVKAGPCFVSVLWRLGMFKPGPITPCSGPIDADHMGDRFKQGNGTRALDSTCVGICHGHHMERHSFAGSFKGFTRDDMRAFTATGVQWTHNRAREVGVVIPAC